MRGTILTFNTIYVLHSVPAQSLAMFSGATQHMKTEANPRKDQGPVQIAMSPVGSQAKQKAISLTPDQEIVGVRDEPWAKQRPSRQSMVLHRGSLGFSIYH